MRVALHPTFAASRKEPLVAMIAGATKPEQAEQNAAAGWALTPDEVTEVDRITAKMT
jgi:aryl-alcohol dehydrogenase-like predicted oxidoreductase